MNKLNVPDIEVVTDADIATMQDEFLRLFNRTAVPRGDRTDSQRYMTKLWYMTVTNWLFTNSLEQLLIDEAKKSNV